MHVPLPFREGAFRRAAPGPRIVVNPAEASSQHHSMPINHSMSINVADCIRVLAEAAGNNTVYKDQYY